MQDIVVGVLALLAGTMFCFSGYRTFRLVIPVWGAFVGFSIGAGAVAAVSGDALLAKPVGWIVGVVLALVFAALAYLYYEVAVILAMGSLGFAAGASGMVALGVTWNWIVVLAGTALGVLFALVAIAANLPRMLLVLVSAVAGATAMIGGAMLLGGAMETADLTRQTVISRIEDDWWWYVIYVFLVLVGIMSQARVNAETDVRDYWAANAWAANAEALDRR